MKLALVSFFAARGGALAAQAAQPPASFAATLNATVVDHFTYSLVRVSEDCSIRRTGDVKRCWAEPILKAPATARPGRSSSRLAALTPTPY
jgi:hypothetical protein